MYVILKATVAGGQRRHAGDVIELSDQEARALLALRRIDVAPPKAKETHKSNDRSVGLVASKTQGLTKRKSRHAN